MRKYSRPSSDDCASENSMVDLPRSSLKNDWLDSKTAAEYLGISIPTLRNMASNGDIPFYKLGRRNRYLRNELHSLMLKSRKGKLWE